MSSICPIEASRQGRPDAGFTLLEILVSTSVFTLIMVVAFALVSQAGNIWKRSSESVEAFQSARTGQDIMTRTISQATLNPYLDYDDPENPGHYLRKSDLQFVVGSCGQNGLPGTPQCGTALFFRAPLGYSERPDLAGLDASLNTCGFFVMLSNDENLPGFLPPNAGGYRYRLFQVLIPAEQPQVFSPAPGDANAWFNASAAEFARPVANNIIAVVAMPGDAQSGPITGDTYNYDSRMGENSDPQPHTANQLPAVMHLALVAIDENSAKRIHIGAAPPAIITSALEGKFQNPAMLSQELLELERTLAAARINVRVFTSTIPLREAKWTK
jgi:uncharacterized protein (TIGR02599 family)